VAAINRRDLVVDPFISTADLEAGLGITLADPNALIVKIALDTACEAVRSYLSQQINYVADDVITLDGNGTAHFRLPQRPVRTVTYVMEDDATLVVDTDYFVRRSTVFKADLFDNWSPGRNNIEVKYTHGYDITGTITLAVPADIRYVALEKAKRAYAAVGVPPTGDEQTETMGSYSYSAAQAAKQAAVLTPEDKELLYPYLSPRVP
jgi:hypothetical protein